MISLKRKRTLVPYSMLAPSVLVLVIVLLYPWIWSFVLSLHSWSVFESPTAEYNGITNYITILTDPLFLLALKNSLIIMIVSVSVQFLLGLATALLLNRLGVSRKIYLTILVIPLMVTPPVAGLIWKVILHKDWGLVNYYLGIFGIEPIGWISDPLVVLTTIIIVQIWQHTPFVILVLLAGLQSIPVELYESATVDGARPSQSFWYITLPWLQPLIFITLMFRALFAIRTFGTVYILFPSGGPGSQALVLGTYLFEHLRVTWHLGEGSTIAYYILILTILISLTFIRDLYRRIEY